MICESLDLFCQFTKLASIAQGIDCPQFEPNLPDALCDGTTGFIDQAAAL
jgi:hypothetical protein